MFDEDKFNRVVSILFPKISENGKDALRYSLRTTGACKHISKVYNLSATTVYKNKAKYLKGYALMQAAVEEPETKFVLDEETMVTLLGNYADTYNSLMYQDVIRFTPEGAPAFYDRDDPFGDSPRTWEEVMYFVIQDKIVKDADTEYKRKAYKLKAKCNALQKELDEERGDDPWGGMEADDIIHEEELKIKKLAQDKLNARPANHASM